jgi:hypothetical protein
VASCVCGVARVCSFFFLGQSGTPLRR